MILYGSSFSPFVRKVIAFAAERGVALENKAILLGDPDPAFRAASPLAKMPALVDGDFSIADSTAIVTYLDGVAPGAKLIPETPRERATVYWWDEFADTELFGVGRRMFFNRVVAPLFQRNPAIADAADADAAERDDLPRILAYLEDVVPEPGGWLVGSSLSLADIAVASPFVNFDHCASSPWADAYPRVAAWVRPILARPSFAGVVDSETRLLAKVRGRGAA
ncbi:glutathione S-transferase family protein [Sphingomonas jatrophae]|uniref:Glutathione S-transferase n=1 Tax=Sphingomonas jatrophae TaxID=1166337 RepID=A0A1I6LCA8_9SPHN|nr:glutathione S-transferase family protein [Sphingomonas jatrophae]SFS00908.1 glutathione S-transferase [Sphingomonas jatrophae]